MYALLAKRPEYNKKIRAMAALATFRRVCHINIWWMNAGSTLENYLGVSDFLCCGSSSCSDDWAFATPEISAQIPEAFSCGFSS